MKKFFALFVFGMAMTAMVSFAQDAGGRGKEGKRPVSPVIRNKEIGFIFQTFNLLPRYDALENVILPLIYGGVPKHERKVRGLKVLDKVGLADRVTHKPNELSGGQRQRVAVARALVNNPSIILADEPTGNLDSKTSVDIMQLIGDIHEQGNTIIVVTHEEDIAKRAQRIIRLLDGHIESDKPNTHRIS